MTPGTVPAARDVVHDADASTEPGPDDPGDGRLRNGGVYIVDELQRSRGQMTPGTPRRRGDPHPTTSRFNGAGAR